MAVLDQISNMTYNTALEPVLDLYEFDHALFDLLEKNARVVDFKGAYIDVPLKYKRLPGGSYEYYDTLTTNAVEQFTKAQYTWKHHQVTAAISSQELIETIGIEADELRETENFDRLGAENAKVLVNLLAEKVGGAPSDLKAQLAAALWSDGTGNSGKDMSGIDAIILNNTSNLGGLATTALGNDQFGNSLWASRVAGTSGNTDTYSLDNIRTDFAAIMQGRAVKKNRFWAVTTPTIVGGLGLTLQGQVRYEPNQAQEMGYQTMTYNMLTFLGDADAAVYHSDAVIYIDLSAIQMFKHKALNNKWSRWAKPDDQEAIVARLRTRAQNICRDRRALGWRQGITL